MQINCGFESLCVPPARVRLLLLIKIKEGVVNKSYFDWIRCRAMCYGGV